MKTIAGYGVLLLDLTENALKILKERYLARDENGNLIEDAEGLFQRVAKHVASADSLYDCNADVSMTRNTFYNMMASLDFLPNSPTLMNAGRPLGQLSACFVLPVEDSLSSIFDAIKQAALIHQSGGGTGFSFSKIRPLGAKVRSSGGIASGPVSFLKVFNAATEVIKQGGTRRGANMGVLRVDHPDIFQFIECKQDITHITNFNISVALTDDFMEAVIQDADYKIISPENGEIVHTLKARDVFDRIVNVAWQTGEPGVLFIDRINESNPIPNAGILEATNPCGEQPLLPYESCNLGSINLANMVSGNEINWSKLESTAQNAVHFLDNVIDVNRYLFDNIKEATQRTRKIGLGVMGFADMLYKLRLRYDSDEAVQLGRKIIAVIREAGMYESQSLANSRGVFPLFQPNTSILRRNATITTIAPTGTLSLLAGVSSGIEPIFALMLTHNVMGGTKLREYNSVLIDIMKDFGVDSPDKLPDDIRDILVTAHEIAPEWHVKMQAAFQEHTDNAVSKTVNLLNSATHEDVKSIILMAYELGCKGITVYRDGSRQGQVLTSDYNHENDLDMCAIGCDECGLPPETKV